jgi:creatinine amidohydrolase/Fe(II)-dependent formamide hydrolase-like protein
MATRSFNMAYSYPKEMEIAKKERWPILIPIGTMEYHSTICPYGCDALVSITIPDSVTTLGEYAFAYCVSLDVIYISKNTVTNNGAFFETQTKIAC